MVKKLKTLCLAILLLFLASISGVYALWIYCPPIGEKTDDLNLNLMEFFFDPGEILYITSVERYSTSNFRTELDYSHSLPTNVLLKGEVANENCTVTYKITVFNNTDVTYWYIGPKITATGSNGRFSASSFSLTLKDTANDSTNTFNTQDWVPPRTHRDFYVTYKFNAGYEDISLLINYYFSIRMDSVQDEFLEILNDKESDNGYYYLADAFNDKYADEKSTVIANVGDELAVFDRLFGKSLTVNVDGTDVPVTVMIQRTNVDGRTTGDAYSTGSPSGCEYTLYITAGPLEPGGEATVYAVSYSCGDDGVWYQIGQLYEGTATAIDYESAAGVQGAINVSTWIATPKTYTVADNIYYKVNQQYGTNFDQLKTITEIQSTNDTEIFNKLDNANILKKVYDILNSSENKYSEAEEVVLLRTAFESMAPYYVNHNNGQEFKIKRDCPRAEILPYIIRLNDAWTYYNEVR